MSERLKNDESPSRGLEQPHETRRLRWRDGIAVGGLAIFVRLVVLSSVDQVPSYRHLMGDAAGYVSWAERIAQGDWLGTTSFYQAPLYPYVLAGIIGLGGDAATVRQVQVVWGACACVLLYVATSYWFGRRVGTIAGVMLALYPPAIYFDVLVQKASLACALLCVLLVAWTWLEQTGRYVSFVVCGVVLGFLILTRENALIWFPLLAAWILLGKCASAYCGWINVDQSLPNDASRKVRASPERSAKAPLSKGGAASHSTALQSVNSDAAGAEARKQGKKAPLVVRLFLIDGAANALLFCAGVALVLGPVGARNRWVGGEWSLSTFQAGPNFFIGNSLKADGRYRPLIPGHETPEFERRDATLLAERDLARRLSPREVSNYWFSRAFADIWSQPMRWIRLMGLKLSMVFNRYEVGDVESFRVYADSSSTLGIINHVWHFGTLFPLAVLGVVEGCWHKRRPWVLYALIVSMALAVVLFYISGRYRYPLVPLLIPLASYGLVELVTRFRKRAGRPLSVALIVLVASALFSNWPVHPTEKLDALAYMNVGVATAEIGELEEATARFRRAIAVHPGSAEAHYNLAMSLAVRGEFKEAIPHYETALELSPHLPNLSFNFGVALEWVGQKKEAVRYFERALDDNPEDGGAKQALIRLTLEP